MRAKRSSRTSVAIAVAVASAAMALLAACEHTPPRIDVQTGARLASSFTPGAMLPTTGPAPTEAELPSAVTLPAATYAAAQASRGQRVYQVVCARCHPAGTQSGQSFSLTWNNRRVSDLHSILVNTMPQDRPGSLTDQQYVDVIAYLLSMNRVAAGAALPSDPAALRKVKIGLPDAR